MTGPYPFQEFGSIDELTSMIADATEGWDTRWYRGTKTPTHTLLPKLFRDPPLKKREGYIATQNGAFTIHGKDDRALEDIIPNSRQNMLLKFVARRDKVEALYGCLDLIIPSSDAVFPDIEGIKDYIV
jgi:hypothetical protein